MIKPSDRRHTVELINAAQEAGASGDKACHEMGINVRTYQRWMQGGRARLDQRPQAKRPVPANKLTPQERDQMLTIGNQTAYQSMAPSQMVPALADDGVDVASESSFYRL